MDDLIRLVAPVVVLGWLLGATEGAANPADLERFFGSYVGVAEVRDLVTGSVEQRDMDIEIGPFHDTGFRIDWINVSLVDGRRDWPGVKRRAQTALFQVTDQGFYIEVEASNPFREREQTRPLRGDPVRWARIDSSTLHVYTVVVLADGRYELQIYDRILTETGLDIRFERIVDDQVLRRITGRTVRAEQGGIED